MHVSQLFVYPVKALGGCAIATAAVDDLGIVGDRRFLVVDENNRFLTQRALPKMCLIKTALSAEVLTLSTAGDAPISIPLHSAPDAVVRSVTIWKSEGLLADDCGDAPAAWLSERLGVNCRLVRIGQRFRRPMTKATAKSGDAVAFTDAYPFMAISEASLADLNQRLDAQHDAPLPMDRFRPSFVIAGCDAYAEDTWTRIRVGNVVLRAGGPCARCLVTTTNQQTAERGKEPLRLFSTYRRSASDPTDVNFGQNFIHETKAGTLHVGDAIEVLE